MSICLFDPCDRSTLATGLCGAHYQQSAKGQELRPIRGQLNDDDTILSNMVNYLIVARRQAAEEAGVVGTGQREAQDQRS